MLPQPEGPFEAQQRDHPPYARRSADHVDRTVFQPGPQLALDLAGVTFIDCAGVNVLLATRRRAGLEDGSVDVIGASPRVRRVISLLGLEWAFGLR